MSWHSANISNDGLVRLVAIQNLGSTLTTFGQTLQWTSQHQIKFTLDGVNPYANLSANHSTWLVFLFNYNLPPWLTTKWLFVMLSLLILGKNQ
jgi:hypothetical protein